MKQKHSDRSVFSKTLYCGACGSPTLRRSFRSAIKNKKYSYYAWRCRKANEGNNSEACNVRNYREECMKHSFMTMLLEMKHSQDEWTREAEQFIVEKDLESWEKERIDFLEVEIRSLNDHLKQVAMTDQENIGQDNNYDIKMDLNQEIDLLQKEWDQLNKKKNEALQIRSNLKWFIEELDDMKDFDPTCECINFREDIFKRVVDRGDIYDDGVIHYELEIGITRKSTGNTQKVGNLRNIEII